VSYTKYCCVPEPNGEARVLRVQYERRDAPNGLASAGVTHLLALFLCVCGGGGYITYCCVSVFVCARISTILCAPTLCLCLGTPPHPIIAHSPTVLRNIMFPTDPPYNCNIYHTISAAAISCKRRVGVVDPSWGHADALLASS